ncbi:MAG: T9SS type A sorting domain-containing protein, partial [Bacteroidia bacterium]
LTNQSLFSFSDIFIAEYDSLGNSNWATNIGGSHIDLIGNICSDSNGAKYIIGTFTSASIYFGPINLSMISTSGLYNDLFIAKFDGTNVGENKIANNNNCTIAPNPFSDFTLVTFNEEQNNTQIRLIDIIGNQVKSFVFTGKQLFIKKDNLMPGLYFVQYIDKNKQLANYKIMVN